MSVKSDSHLPNSLQLALLNSLKQHAAKQAIFFENTYFSYNQLLKKTCQLQAFLFSKEYNFQSIGIIANNDFNTYAAIVTCLLSGITYVPLEPAHPDERNNYIVETSSIDVIYCSDITTLSNGFFELHQGRFLPAVEKVPDINEPFVSGTAMPAYILFTSGTTGIPKGVPITIENLETFADNVDRMGLSVTDEDRFLQAFDLTFDLSIFSYLIPLLKGACIYTVPKAPFRNMLAVQLIEEQCLTHVLTVPSFINYIQPFLKDTKFPTVKYWLFCGEALKTRHVQALRACLPNAEIINAYGPTEATIFCTYYACKLNETKERNGVVCIGKPFGGTFFELFNDRNCVTGTDYSGELCIAGRQLTRGYLESDKYNQQKFFEYNKQVYYRTGDLCSMDSDSDYFFEGRNDSQIKINGYRVELGEIENIALKVSGIKDAVAIAINESESAQIILFLIGDMESGETIVQHHLKKNIPDYMLPKKFIFIEKLPYNLNGKIDRKSLRSLYEKSV